MTYAQHLKPAVPKTVSPRQPIPGREKEMTLNPAGAYAFTTTSWRRANRFLMIGAEGGTYYEGEKKLTLDAAKAILECMNDDAIKLIGEIVRISDGGQAQSNSPAIFALAIIAAMTADVRTRQVAFGALRDVCRTGTHLFEFMDAYQTLRGHKGAGRTVRKALSAWYNNRKPQSLAYQLIKYQQREGWSHKDVIKLGHVEVDKGEKNCLIQWAIGREVEFPKMSQLLTSEEGTRLIAAFEEIKRAENPNVAARLIVEHRLPREAVPTQFLNNKDVWSALLTDMPYMALMRNLPKLTELGFFEMFGGSKHSIADKLTDQINIKGSRVHPLAILLAKQTYQSGESLRGSKTWVPSRIVIDALEDAFYLAMDNIEPTNTNDLLAIDCSGSMEHACNGVPNMSAREVSVAFALCYLKGNPKAELMGFTQREFDLSRISPKMRLDEAIRVVDTIAKPEGTDCGVVFNWAIRKRLPVDNFLMFTDSMSWGGSDHPSRAAAAYRKGFKPDAKWVLVQTTATGTSIQDPKDLNAMEFAGFAPSMFTVAREFFQGNL